MRSYECRALRSRAAGTSLCGGVTAYFADGTSAEGSVLVGADGIRSVVRSQRAPHAETVEAGILAIYGRVPMETGRAIVSPETLEDIFTVATHERKVFLGLGAVRVLTPPDIASAALAPQTELKAQPDYLVSIVGGRHEHFPRDREAMRAASSAELQEIAAGMLAPWPERTGEGRVAQRELRASRRREPPFMPSCTARHGELARTPRFPSFSWWRDPCEAPTPCAFFLCFSPRFSCSPRPLTPTPATTFRTTPRCTPASRRSG